jgi:uncharacterized protein (UPF0335 family)
MSDSINASQLQAFIRRYENIDEDIKKHGEDKKELLAEIKSAGYDTKYFKHVVKLLAMSDDDRANEDAMLEMYRSAAGIPVTS